MFCSSHALRVKNPVDAVARDASVRDFITACTVFSIVVAGRSDIRTCCILLSGFDVYLRSRNLPSPLLQNICLQVCIHVHAVCRRVTRNQSPGFGDRPEKKTLTDKSIRVLVRHVWSGPECNGHSWVIPHRVRCPSLLYPPSHCCASLTPFGINIFNAHTIHTHRWHTDDFVSPRKTSSSVLRSRGQGGGVCFFWAFFSFTRTYLSSVKIPVRSGWVTVRAPVRFYSTPNGHVL